MDGIAELKKLIEDDNKLTHELQQKFDKLGDDYIAKAEYKKLEDAVALGAKERATAEVKYNAEFEKLRVLAEEASLKAGRRGGIDGDEPDEINTEHKNAFIAYMRNRSDYDAQNALKTAEAAAIEAKAVTGTSGSSGGYAVPTVISTLIHLKAADEAVMRPLVNVVQVGTSDWKELVDKGGMGYGWVGEDDVRAATDTPQIYEVTPPMGTIYAYPQATEESLDDMFFNVESWLVKHAGAAFATGQDDAIIGGNGTNKPLGFLATAPVATADGARADKILQYLATGAADDFGVDAHKNIIDLIYALKAKYRKQASFCMNSLTTARVRVLKDSTGRPLWQDNQIIGEPPKLEGYGVNAVEAMPDIAANSHPISFGDYKAGYTYVERHNLRITKDEITKPGYVKWHIRERCGGATTNDDAIKVMKFAAS